jgi:hypothetical protein
MLWRAESTSSHPGPGSRPGPRNDTQHQEDAQCETGVEDDAGGAGSGVLFGLSRQVGEDSSTQGADLADHISATAVVSGQRRGTSWKVAPLPASNAAKHSTKRRVVAVSDGTVRNGILSIEECFPMQSSIRNDSTLCRMSS